MDDTDASALRAQIAALTAAVQALTGAKPATTITIATLFAEFEKTRSAQRSWRENRNRLLPLVRRLGALPAAQLTPMLWAEHRAARAQEPHKYGPAPKPHTLSIELGRAKELMNWGVAMGFLDRNPIALVKRDKTISQRETWLDDAGVAQLLTGLGKLPGERPRLIMQAFILLCLDGMFRFNEARGLRRDRVRSGVVELAAKSTKGKRSRVVALTPRVLQAIAEVPPVVGSPYVFANPTHGRPYSAMMIRYWFRAVCVASKVDALAADGERVVLHTLRHSGASAADARGAAATAIRDALGHSTLAVTEKYLHRHKDAGARELAAILAKPAGHR